MSLLRFLSLPAADSFRVISVELDQLTFHMNVKWHHAWSKRIVDPNASPESVQPAYAVQPLPEDTEMDYMNA